ncbi:hypothetical protein AQUCO_03300073v1 [Aquilegia coerulea]|uniref:Protein DETOXIFICATION n=1 Tax=Aquilegia coerulea TaxID=218851 RepID=A0A2G5CZC0_AQUCA|nr:hypothetical protein AQUCO_03300073v1 [Aquilegia coerulea]
MALTKAPLLEKRYGEEEEEKEKKKGGFWNKLVDVEEVKTQFMFSVPMIITTLAYYAITLVSVMFAGHLGELELAASTLANSWATVSGLALVTGLSGALETLCGQAYGAKLYRMLGIYLQSSIIISFFFSIIISFVWFYSEPILLLLHQKPQVAKMTAIYLRYFIPGLFAYAMLQCMLRFLQTQTVVTHLVICSVAPLAIQVGLCYVIVFHTVLGFKGAALSAAISLWISVLMLGLYINYSDKFKYTWQGLSMESFEHVLPSMKLAIPSAVMVCLEFSAFELLVLLAGLMPNSVESTSLTAMCINTEAVALMITYGFSAAVSTRVSNELGAGNADRAKNAVAVTLKLSIFLALAVVLCLLFGHNLWASAFTNSPVIMKDFASMTPFLAISMLFDSVQVVLSGVARGCGWQVFAAWTNLVAFYVIGMPIAVFTGFKLQLYARAYSY